MVDSHNLGANTMDDRDQERGQGGVRSDDDSGSRWRRRRDHGGGFRISDTVLGVLVSVVTSALIVSNMMGDATARLTAVEGQLKAHIKVHENLDVRLDSKTNTKDFDELKRRTNTDHDLIIQIGANIEHIRERLETMAKEKSS